MKMQMLNRIRKGMYIAAEIQHENPGYRKWVGISPVEERSPLDPNYERITHKYEIWVVEQEWFENELDFYEEGRKLLALYKLDDEQSMLEQAAQLVPSTDIFNIPSRAFNFVSPK